MQSKSSRTSILAISKEEKCEQILADWISEEESYWAATSTAIPYVAFIREDFHLNAVSIKIDAFVNGADVM